MHLVWLATDRQYEGNGLGSLMVGRVITMFADIGTRIGIPHLILTPADEDKERLIKFYSGLGFQPYNDGESMFLSIDRARHALAAVSAGNA